MTTMATTETTKAVARRRGRPRSRTFGPRDHGIVERYTRGCRCAKCRAAWANYMRDRRARLAPPRAAPEPKAPPAPKRDLTYYRGKDPKRPVTSTMTALGLGILDATRARTGRSVGDIFEKLLRDHAAQLVFDDDEAVA